MPHTSKPNAPSIQGAPSKLTAPRKPVAWQYQDIDWGDDWAPISKSSYDNFVRGDVTGTRDIDWRVRELYESAPDLKPLWSLVEKWEKEGAECRAVATDQEEQGDEEDAECNYSQAWRFEECAAALRELLEAMQ